MSPALRALLEGVIDYAGLFPPAQLPLDAAIRNYARYRHDADAWMLGRFVIPAARLEELSPFVTELFATGPPLGLVVLGRSADTVHGWAAAITADVEAIAAFRHRHGERVSIDGFEVRLPADATDAEAVASCVKAVTHALPNVTAFFESPSQREDHPALAAVMAEGIAAGAGGF